MKFTTALVASVSAAAALSLPHQVTNRSDAISQITGTRNSSQHAPGTLRVNNLHSVMVPYDIPLARAEEPAGNLLHQRRPPDPVLNPMYDAKKAAKVEYFTVEPRDTAVPASPPVTRNTSVSVEDIGPQALQDPAWGSPSDNRVDRYQAFNDGFTSTLVGQPPPWSLVPTEAQEGWAGRTSLYPGESRMTPLATTTPVGVVDPGIWTRNYSDTSRITLDPHSIALTMPSVETSAPVDSLPDLPFQINTGWR